MTVRTRIDRLMAEVTDAALSAAAPKLGETLLRHWLRDLHNHPTTR